MLPNLQTCEKLPQLANVWEISDSDESIGKTTVKESPLNDSLQQPGRLVQLKKVWKLPQLIESGKLLS